MPTITRLQMQPRQPQLVNVHLDGEFAFSLALDLAGSLSLGQTLTDSMIATLRRDSAYQVALGRALRFLGYRPRSEAEVRARMAEWELEEPLVDRVVARLLQLRLLDDAAFAEWWVESRGRHAPRGRMALRSELRRKGVATEQINQSLEGVDELAAALTLAAGRAPRLSALERKDFQRRLGGFLARRGFGPDSVRKAVDEAWASVEREPPGADDEAGWPDD